MGKFQPITDAEEKAICDDIDAGLSRRAIATKHGRAPVSISRVAERNGRHFDRTATAEATLARVTDLAARRAILAEKILSDAERMRERTWQEHHQWMGSPDGPELVTLDLPPLKEVRDNTHAVQNSVETHIRLIEVDQRDDQKAAKSLLTSMAAAFGLTTPTPTPTPTDNQS